MMPFLALSIIHAGTSSFVAFSSWALQAAQRFAHLSSSLTSAIIHSGVSLPSAFNRLDSVTAHLSLPLFSSSDTILSIHSGMVAFSPSASLYCFTIFLAHWRVLYCSMRCFRCFHVSSVSFLHHSGASSAIVEAWPKEPTTPAAAPPNSAAAQNSLDVMDTMI